MKCLTLDDLDFYYQIIGNGDPVVLVHGMGSDHTVWDGLVPLFKESYRTIAVDLRGHGSSSKPAGPYSAELFANDIFRILESLHIKKAHFMGHSMGGAITQSLAIQYPDKVRSQTLISSFAYLDSHLEHILMELLQIVDKKGYNAFFETCLKLANTPQFVQENKELLMSFRDERAPIISIDSIKDTINACLKIDLIDSLNNIRAPTLIIAGSNDIFTPPYHSNAIKNKITGSIIQIMDLAPHNLLVEQPENTYILINEFLKEL
jgi:pimeloyl-ACP methyl ester carboxylesterase